MNKLYEKLKTWDEKKSKLAMKIGGVLVGILVWVTLILSGESKDQLIGMSFLVVFVAAMLLSNKIGKEVGWNMNTFRLSMVVGLGGGIIVYVIYGLVTGKMFV